MKLATFLALCGLAALAACLPACSSNSTSGSASSSAAAVAASVQSAVNTIAQTLSADQTTEAVSTTASALQAAGVIDPATAAEIVAADAIISNVSGAVATATGTAAKAVTMPGRLQAARLQAFTAILQAHQAAIRPDKLARVIPAQ